MNVIRRSAHYKGLEPVLARDPTEKRPQLRLDLRRHKLATPLCGKDAMDQIGNIGMRHMAVSGVPTGRRLYFLQLPASELAGYYQRSLRDHVPTRTPRSFRDKCRRCKPRPVGTIDSSPAFQRRVRGVRDSVP